MRFIKNTRFLSGDIVRMETTEGPATFMVVDYGDPDWLEMRWDWPMCPLDREYDRE